MATCRAATARCRLSANCGSDVTRPKNMNKLQRRKPQRAPYEHVLIVCEGEKTETGYLHELCRAQNLASVRIVGRGAGPKAVWVRAQEEFERDRDYDRIFCVFDRDTHAHYAAVIDDIHQHVHAGKIGKRRAGKTVLTPVPSDPCFEFWLLLHFQFTTAAFTGPGDVLSRLRRCEGMADYQKNQTRLFGQLQPRLGAALANAKSIRRQTDASGADGPRTDFDCLVEYLLAQGKLHG